VGVGWLIAESEKGQSAFRRDVLCRSISLAECVRLQLVFSARTLSRLPAGTAIFPRLHWVWSYSGFRLGSSATICGAVEDNRPSAMRSENGIIRIRADDSLTPPGAESALAVSSGRHEVRWTAYRREACDRSAGLVSEIHAQRRPRASIEQVVHCASAASTYPGGA